MKKRSLLVGLNFNCFVFVFVTLVGVVRAESPLRLGFVKMQTVIEQSESGQRARGIIEEKLERSKRIIDSATQELQQEQDRLEKKLALLSPEGVAQEQQNFHKRRLELQRKIDDEQLALRNVNDSELAKVVAEVDKAIARVQEKEGLDLILEVDPSTVIYFDAQYDLTKYVVDLIND